MNWFLYALIALFFWSGSDLFSKMGSKPDDKYSHWKMVMAVGFMMGLHAMYELLISKTEFKSSYIITYMPASALYILSMILGYVGLRYIVLSISSPICNSSGAIASILCFFILKETVDELQVVGIVLVSFAVISLAVIEKRQNDAKLKSLGEEIDRKAQFSFIAVFFPIFYCIIDGLGTTADAIILETMPEKSANVAYELTFFAMAVFALIYMVVVKKQKIEVPKETPKIVGAVCETAGQMAYVFALAANPTAAAPMISAYCVLSLIWARLFLKEKLSKLQYAVILIAFAGIVILGRE